MLSVAGNTDDGLTRPDQPSASNCEWTLQRDFFGAVFTAFGNRGGLTLQDRFSAALDGSGLSGFHRVNSQDLGKMRPMQQ